MVAHVSLPRVGWSLVWAAAVALWAAPFARAGDEPGPLGVAKALSEAYADLFDRVAPSVVSIRTVSGGPAAEEEGDADADAGEGGEGGEEPNARPRPRGGRPGDDPDMMTPEDLMRRFFGEGGGMPDFFGPGPGGGRRRRPAPRVAGQGSGVVIDGQGHILTNNHVVEGATEIAVTFRDGGTADAEIVGRDEETDLAVIRLKDYSGTLAPARLGDSAKVRTGNIVIAIGSPFGAMHSMSTGIVSGTDRTLRAINYERYIQTDAAINPGNSGGPLINLDGEVVGINTIINTRTGGSVGVGFAVPANYAKNVARQLVDKGRVTRGWLGITMRDVDADLKAVLPGVDGGAFVEEVHPEGPAAAGGMRRGDVITAVDGRAIPTSRDLQERIADLPPDAKVTIAVMRRGDDGQRTKVDLAVTLAERTREVLRRSEGRAGLTPRRPGGADTPREETYEAARWGLTVREIHERDGNAFGGEKGVVVARVAPRGAAAELGLERGMLLIEVDEKATPDLAAARGAFAGAEKKEAVLLVVQPRNSTPRHVVMKLK